MEHGPGKKPEDPLAVPKPRVARYSRTAIFTTSVVGASILAFALVGTFSPKKGAESKEMTAAADKPKPNQPAPDPPDPFKAAPKTYPELKSRQNAQGTLVAPQQNGIAGTAGVAPGAAGLSPQDQAAKDAATAMTSPVTFGNVGNGSQPQQNTEPAPPEVVVPSISGVQKPLALGVPDQNMQDEKRNFSGERSADIPYIKASIITPLSEYEVKAGTILPTLLITGINSDLPGQLTAQIRENVYDTATGNYLLIPQGARLIGEYDSKIAYGQERVLIVWTRIIFPNGDSISLEGMPGTDLSGYAGMGGKVNNHYGKLITGVILGSIVGAGAQVAVGGQGAPNVPPSFGQLAASGAAQNINQVGQEMAHKNLNIQPSIEVSPGDKVNVFVTKDMILKPYRE